MSGTCRKPSPKLWRNSTCEYPRKTGRPRGSRMPATTKPELAAQRLLRDVGKKKGAVLLERIAKRLGIEIVEKPLGAELSGVLINKEGESIAIVVNSEHPENRRRFTIAHEIGHYVLGHPGEMFVDQTLRQRAVVVKRDGRSSEGT